MSVWVAFCNIEQPIRAEIAEPSLEGTITKTACLTLRNIQRLENWHVEMNRDYFCPENHTNVIRRPQGKKRLYNKKCNINISHLGSMSGSQSTRSVGTAFLLLSRIRNYIFIIRLN